MFRGSGPRRGTSAGLCSERLAARCSSVRRSAVASRLIAIVVAVSVAGGLSPASASGALKWRIVSTPFGPSPGAYPFLWGVSCQSVVRCLAVGELEADGASFGSSTWNGISWGHANQSSAASAVSCAPTSLCMTVNGPPDYANQGVNAAIWDGTTWSFLPSPAQLSSSGASPSGVSCPTANDCVVVGNETGGAWVATWNGSSWSVGSIPAPPGAALGPVSCSSVMACTAAGPGLGGTGPAFADHWDGQTWSLEMLPVPVGTTSISIGAVSCPSSGDCTAVGRWSEGNDDPALANPYIVQRANGRWSLQPVQFPPSSLLGVCNWLRGVSCVGSNACVAVGSAATPIAAQWNGTYWSNDPTSPDVAPGGFDTVGLASVSCVSATVCFAVGSALKVGVGSYPLVETTAPAGEAALGRTPSRCVTHGFSVGVTGTNIGSVQWRLDGRRLRGRTLHRSRAYSTQVRLTSGRHTLISTVVFQASVFTPNATFRRTLTGCPARNRKRHARD